MEEESLRMVQETEESGAVAMRDGSPRKGHRDSESTLVPDRGSLTSFTSNTTDDSTSSNESIESFTEDEDIDRQARKCWARLSGRQLNYENQELVGPAARRPSLVHRVKRASFSMIGHINVTAQASMEEHLDPRSTVDASYDGTTLAVFCVLQTLVFGLMVLLRPFPTLSWTLIITASTMFLMTLYTKAMSTTTRTDRIVHAVGMVVILALSSLLMMLITSSCSYCVFHLASESPFAGMGNAWDLLLGDRSERHDDGNQGASLCACRQCVSGIFSFAMSWKSWVVTKRMEDAPALLDMDSGKPVQADLTADSMLGDLASWYIQQNNMTLVAKQKIIDQKFAMALAADGRLKDEELREIMEELLCSPASRVDNPNPSVFLSELKRARFTGEQGGVNISTSKLQSIMRGDILKELGVPLCFSLRFALFIREDMTLEKHPISHTQLLPITNEEGMKAVDRTHTFPFLITPGIDQDVDVDGSQMKRIERALDIFCTFPFHDEPLYFETHDEYYAFYRWELGTTIQDEWFFPQWFLYTEKAAAFTQFHAKKQLYQNEHIALEDPYSDRTFGDRVFHGAAQEFLAPVKFPGINEDFEYKFPENPHTFMTEDHREYWRYANKPSSGELLDMIYAFWPREEKKGRKLGDHSEQLARYKTRILEADYASWETFEMRETFIPPGGILYVDPVSKLPMGLWEANRKYMYLPSDPDWEHAKYYFRVLERVILATRHVVEAHLAWAHPMATASWQTLPPTHGLRVLLKPYTLQTHSVNWAAYQLLARNHSILNHASGYTQKGYTKFFMDIWKDFNFTQTIPDQFAARKLDRVVDPNTFEFYRNGRKLWDIHRTFVENFVHVLFPTDRSMLEDKHVVRFWHHVNTYGRLLDPCVCGLEPNQFFDKEAWPGFESTYKCEQLLDHVGYRVGAEPIIRRRDWCEETAPFDKVKAVRQLLESQCENRADCDSLPYNIHGMRADMGLTELKTRSQLIDYITRVIWEVTVRHKFLSDNLPYFTDAKYSGVRMREFGPDGELPTMNDIGTHVFANVIGGLTSVRTPPLLADWTPLYSHFAAQQTSLSGEQRRQLFDTLDSIHKGYKFDLLDLSIEIFDDSLARPLNQRSNTMNPATHASSVAI